MNKNLASLERALDGCLTSTEYVVVIRKITRTRDPGAIAVLASLLDSPGPIGAAAVRGLKSFGPLAETEMRRCVAQSMDEDQIRNAHRVLAALGDAYSRRAVRACCWADLDDEDAIAARAADAANDSAPPASAIVRAASQPDRPWAALDRPDPASDRASPEGYRPPTAVERPETRGDRR